MRYQLPLALLLASSAAACVDSASATDTAAVTSDLEKETGGFDTTDEAPLFAEDALFTAAGLEGDFATADAMASDPTIATMQANPAVTSRDVVVMWGRFPADPTATDARDWSGDLQISRGGVLVTRKIAFEDRTDSLAPRTLRNRIDFKSVTRPAADGLALRVLDPTPTATDPLTLTLTVNATSVSYPIDLGALANGPVVVDAGGGFKIIAIGERHDDGCRHGFMRGRWHALSAHAGVYLGVVANGAGEMIGHVRGIYGQRQNGDPVMFGKFINRDGQFVGVLKGTYDNGHFAARWLDRAGDHGGVHGLYFEGPNGRGGGFLARWAEASCSDAPTPAGP